ncbi:universal stress protein [Halogeometricum borinquense]|uniref:Universal stress protein n=1 Tax=Halogeometricum borinquense TaxID=60847 RepID=A0A482T2A0_9EURY|nr:universal stress protein [Halogeometricum borinquense]RYJ08162.1 universal stress protein [Halogeometricum borinquense]
MLSRLTEGKSSKGTSSDGWREASVERVLCLFDAEVPVDNQFVQVAATLADGGRFVVPVDNTTAAQALKPESADVSVEYETRFLERPATITTEWVQDVVNRFDITTIFDIRDHRSTLGGGEFALTTESNHVTVTPGNEVASLSSCLVPVARGPHLDTTLNIARVIGETHDAWIDFFHVVDNDESRSETDALFEYCTNHLGDFDEFDTWRYEGWSPAQAIVDQSSYYDATVIAAPQKSRLREFVDGSTTEVVQSLCENTVVTVRSGDVDASRLDRWLGELLAPKN